MVGSLNRVMEESGEPQLDAKSKVRSGLEGTGAAGSETRKTVPFIVFPASLSGHQPGE